MAWTHSPGDPLIAGFPFKDLDDAEEQDFIGYAALNEPDPTKWDLYHPVCRKAWAGWGQAPGTKEGI